MDAPLLALNQISKHYPGMRALWQVQLTLRAGEVLGLVGENGAGKSTLMGILAGIQRPDSGTIQLAGRPVTIDSVTTALRYGIALIHQELDLVGCLDIASNIYLGREPARWGFVKQRSMRADAARLLTDLGLKVAPTTRVRSLTVGQQQRIEIARALSVDARILIMDEPTSSLSAQESSALFQVIRDLKRRGVAIIYISHRLAEVQLLADRVTVLKDGCNAGELVGEQIDHDHMVRLMVGRDASRVTSAEGMPTEETDEPSHSATGRAEASRAPGEPILEVRSLVTRRWPQHRLTLSVRRGECVALAGLVGAGRTELLQALFGIQPAVAGEIRVSGRLIAVRHPSDAKAAGMALVPEDRKVEGLILSESIPRNIGLASLNRQPKWWCFVDGRRESADAHAMQEMLHIKSARRSHQPVRLLSGGNQQKVVLGKWLCRKPHILLMDEPTRGIDVAARQEIYDRIAAWKLNGMAILFASNEMEEVLALADRVLVMHEGRLAGELTRNSLTEQEIMVLATGGKAE